MEKQIKIPIANKKYIYGTLRGSLKNPLLVFVHGFTGYKDEHIFFNGARFFEKKGFSTFRFDLYNWNKDARKLEDCTLSLHGEDLDTVIKYLRKKRVGKIVLAVPVMPEDSVEKFKKLADELIVLETPLEFHSVGEFYENFPQVTDEEVINLLHETFSRTR